MNGKEISERIKMVMDYYNLSVPELSEKTNIKSQNLYSILSGNRVAGEGVLNKILLSFDEINKEWLKTGSGEMIYNVGDINISGDNSISNSGSIKSGNITIGSDGDRGNLHKRIDELEEENKSLKESLAAQNIKYIASLEDHIRIREEASKLRIEIAELERRLNNLNR